MAGLNGATSLQKQLDTANAQNQSYQQQLQALQNSINRGNVYAPSYIQQAAPIKAPIYTPNANATWNSSHAIAALANAGLTPSSGTPGMWMPSASASPAGIASLMAAAPGGK